MKERCVQKKKQYCAKNVLKTPFSFMISTEKYVDWGLHGITLSCFIHFQ